MYFLDVYTTLLHIMLLVKYIFSAAKYSVDV